MMDYMSLQDLLTKDCQKKTEEEDLWTRYAKTREDLYRTLIPDHLEHSMVSEANWVLRNECTSCESMGMEVKLGDICFMDFGQAYINEMGYQHFGLIMSICQKKALVIPMTSNPVQYESAYDPTGNPDGKIHLMRIGKVDGLNRPSVLFLNDMKFVNTARVIGVRARIEPDSALFRRIQQRMMQIMFMPKHSC